MSLRLAALDAGTTLRVALDALKSNLIRSGLAMLGVVIGVAAVIAMVSLGQGAETQVKARIEAMGSNILYLRAGSLNAGGISGGGGSGATLTAADIEAIPVECPAVKGVSPGVSATGLVIYGNQNWQTRVEGGGAPFPAIRNWKVASGEFFTEADVRTAARVVVLGKTLVKNLFEGADPVGQMIRIRNLPFRVVGVLAEKGENDWGRDQDDTAIAPYTTVMKKMLATTNVTGATMSAVSSGATAIAAQQVTELLRQRHRLAPNEPDDFTVRNMTEIADTLRETSKVWSMLLGGIALVSLLVGGIGIMNIMLVSVTERTREIGLRRALGARQAQVRLQFLVEAVVLCTLGGLLGVAVGAGLSLLFAHAFSWPSELSAPAVIGAVLFSALVGVGFGYYPAHKASSLDPVEALHYE